MTTIAPVELAAFADGELPDGRAAEVATLVAADPDLARQVAAHRALKGRLAAHYAPIMDQPVPDALAALLRPPAPVVDFAAARQKREAARRLPRWSWIVPPALAASLALALFLPRGGELPEGYADATLASALDTQLVADQSPGAETRVLLSFRDASGQYCRAFSGAKRGGIACRNERGWKLEALGAGSQPAQADYQMAGAADAAILARAQELATDGALDAAAEAEAKSNGWH